MASILLGVTGGIAAYKACEVLRLLDKASQRVRVVMTRSATEFVGPLTFETLSRAPVLTDARPLGDDGRILHIDYADRSDLFLIAPATANVIGKLATGVADDALTTTALAFRGPVVIAPAMNVNMWRHETVQANVKVLRDRGVRFVDPDSGDLACGWVGDGRLAEPADIVVAAFEVLKARHDLAGLKILVSAGPTCEPIDPVRVITNRSSGKMGYAIAEAAVRRGAAVDLVSGPVALAPYEGANVMSVETAREMRDAMTARAPAMDMVVMCAAVADYCVADPAGQKIKKTEGALTLTLTPNDDILKMLGESKPKGQVLVGFAAETRDVVASAAAKLHRKKADLFVANDVSRPGIGFGSDENEVTLVFANGRTEEVPRAPKDKIASRVLDAALAIRREL
jgi:phosphopantothenoylcysteine decarboxylase/phosphopantothenate--cysteine ligase